MTIGITGGIGSGKSTIARALAARGFTVYDCDREAKRIIAENQEVQSAIKSLFGEESFINGVYNTAYIAQRVFSDPQLLEKLNEIVHPAVKADIISLPFREGAGESSCLFLESAILYESGFDKLCDKIIFVEAPEDIRIARTISRDYNGISSPANISKVRTRIQAQEKKQHPHSDVPTLLIQNDGSLSISEIADQITHWM